MDNEDIDLVLEFVRDKLDRYETAGWESERMDAGIAAIEDMQKRYDEIVSHYASFAAIYPHMATLGAPKQVKDRQGGK